MRSEPAAGVVDLRKRSPPPASGVHPWVARRLATVAPDPRSWVPTCAVAFVGAVLRLVNLGHPDAITFDETYYAVEADELIHHGVEWDPKNNWGDRVVHPPLGKGVSPLGSWSSGTTRSGGGSRPPSPASCRSCWSSGSRGGCSVRPC